MTLETTFNNEQCSATASSNGFNNEECSTSNVAFISSIPSLIDDSNIHDDNDDTSNYFTNKEWKYQLLLRELSGKHYDYHYIKSVRHLLDEKCVRTLFSSFIKEDEVNDCFKRSIREIWEMILEACEEKLWFNLCIQECMQMVLGMKKHNMWILKFLFRSGYKISQAAYEAENSKPDRSEAFKILLYKNIDKNNNNDQSSSYSKATKHEEKRPRCLNTKAPVKLNMTWSTGSFKCDITNGHTILKEVNGEFELDIQMN
jgi:hypothetical protein